MKDPYTAPAVVQPYGTGQGAAPDPQRSTRWRYGIRVDADVRGPQRVTTMRDPAGGHEERIRIDAARAAQHAANAHRAALRELGIGDEVIPWVQRVTTVTTVTFSEHEDLP